MARVPHVEKHFTAPEAVRDVVIGMADGLTVPFALAAGLSGAVSSIDANLRASEPRSGFISGLEQVKCIWA